MSPRLSLIIFTFYSLTFCLQAQKTNPSMIGDRSRIPVIKLELPDEPKHAISDQKQDPRLKKKKFARNINTSINTKDEGIWTSTDNYHTWSVGIESEDAHALTFKLENVQMHAGAKLYFFDRTHTNYTGPYTRHDVTEHQLIITPPVMGALIYLEYQVPKHQQQGNFRISRVGHVMSSKLKDSRYQLSGDCHMDVNCYSDDQMQKLKNGVVRILINNNEYCTGILVNNTREDEKAYVITANHCIDTPNKARNSLFHFGYESPSCHGPDATFKTVVGSELIATTDNLDFSLVELSQEPDFLYHPYFAGWNNQPITPENVYSIHHPQGDVKKVAVDVNELIIKNFGAGYDDQAHWNVETWESGSTEQGSSGSPLFNTGGEVVGVLSGGSASCEFPNSDYFQRFDLAWDKYTSADNQLKAWLDPDNTGKLTMNGHDPYAALTQSGDTLSNLLDTDSPLLYQDDDWGYISGHSATGNTVFAEKFSVDSDRTFFGVTLNTAKAFTANDTSRITLKLWKGSDQPEELISEQDYLLDYFLEGESIFIQWENPIPVDSGNFFAGYELYYQSEPLDTFAVFHSPARDTEENNTAFAAGDMGWQPIHHYYPGTNVSLDIQPIVFDSVPVKVVRPFTDGQENFRLRPVPAKNNITVDLENYHSRAILGNVYNSQGKLIRTFRIDANHKSKEISTATYPNGIYIVTLRINEKMYSEQFMVVK